MNDWMRQHTIIVLACDLLRSPTATEAERCDAAEGLAEMIHTQNDACCGCSWPTDIVLALRGQARTIPEVAGERR